MNQFSSNIVQYSLSPQLLNALPYHSARLDAVGVDPGISDNLRESNELREAKDVALDKLNVAVLVFLLDEKWMFEIVGLQVHAIREVGVEKCGRKGDEDRFGLRRKVRKGVRMGVVVVEDIARHRHHQRLPHARARCHPRRSASFGSW